MRSHREWAPADGIVLEPNAEIACRELVRSTAITAGPGAGKTELLAQRADFLLRTNNCPYPKRILAISFKADAAANLADRVHKRVASDLAGRLDSHTFHAFALRLIQRFRPILNGDNQLDPGFTVGDERIPRLQITYKDMVPLAVDILNYSTLVRAGLRNTYSHVFLDEFQDCTREQYALIRTAFHGTDVQITAVGDTKQRIMGWAGALERIFETLAEDFDARSLNLYQNRRAAPRLRRMQNRMIAIMDSGAALAEESLTGDGGQIDVCHSRDQGEEASQITGWIQNLIAEGVPETEIAVLYSKQPEHYGDSLFRALNDADIPYRNDQQLQDLAVQPLTKLLLSYLQLLVNDRSPTSYIRINRSQLFSVHEESDQIRLRTQWEHFIKDKRRGIRGDVTALSDQGTLEKLMRDFLEFFGAGAISTLHPEYESATRVGDLVVQVIERVLELVTAGSSVVEALRRFLDEPGVRIMSIHKSKGLEFSAVAVPAVEREMFWSDPAGERASFFVAISRARKYLLLTHADFRSRPPKLRTRWSNHRTAHHEFLSYAEK